MALTLPWENPSGPTIGELKASSASISSGSNTGMARLRCLRETSAFGPGDLVQLRVEVEWQGTNALEVTAIEFVLLEIVTFVYPNAGAIGAEEAVRSPPRMTPICFAHAEQGKVDPRRPELFGIIGEGQSAVWDLNANVPADHRKTTVSTAKVSRTAGTPPINRSRIWS